MDERDELEMELDAPNDDEWDDARFTKRMDKVASASQNLGSLLLQGWTMLAEECPKCHTPMMSLRGAEPRCVMCKPVEAASDPKFHPKSDAVIIQRRKKEPIKNVTTLKTVNELRESNLPQKMEKARFGSTFGSTFGQRMEKGQDASARIGELLLKGWTMLAEHCDKCQSPLMSLRGGTPMCCVCDTPNEIVIQKKQTTKVAKAEEAKVTSIKQDHPTGLFANLLPYDLSMNKNDCF